MPAFEHHSSLLPHLIVCLHVCVQPLRTPHMNCLRHRCSHQRFADALASTIFIHDHIQQVAAC
jgi:hypothetical protein